MELAWALGKLVVGFTILIVGGEALVAAAVSMASRFKVSPATVGLTVIAAGTSAPELLTSLIAALENTPDIAIGNVIGSNVFNILAILGVSALVTPLLVEKDTMNKELPALIGFSVVFGVFIMNLTISRWEGALCLVALNLFLAYSVIHAKKKGHSGEELPTLKNWFYDFAFLSVGLLALVGGAKLALDGGVAVGTIAGLSERVIGVTIISVGTGLPELATSMVAAFKGRNDIAVSNVVGSNLLNTFGVTGVAATASPIIISPQLAGMDTYIMIGITAILWPAFFLQGKKITRPLAVIMITVYIAYVTYLLIRN